VDFILKLQSQIDELGLTGNTFGNNYVLSIIKKRRKRLDILEIEPSLSISNMGVKYTESKTGLGR